MNRHSSEGNEMSLARREEDKGNCPKGIFTMLASEGIRNSFGVSRRKGKKRLYRLKKTWGRGKSIA